MVVVEDSWRIPHPADRVAALLADPGPLLRGLPDLASPRGPDGDGRLRLRLGPTHATLIGGGRAHPLPGEGTVWEATGRRARGPGRVSARVAFQVEPADAQAAVRLRAEVAVHDWEPPPSAAALEAALRRLAAGVHTHLRLQLERVAGEPAAAGAGPDLPPIEVVPGEPQRALAGGIPLAARHLARAARDRWPAALLLGVGAIAAVIAARRGRTG